MILTFKNKTLQKFFESGSISKINQDHVKRLKIILAKLHTAKQIRDMEFPGAYIHQLTGDKKGFWSVRINKNWRLIFRFENGDAFDVDYMDYH